MMHEIETTRLLLRLFREEDVDELAEIFGDPEVMKYLPGGKPRARKDTAVGLTRTIEGFKRRGFGIWAATHKEQGGLVGYCGLVYLDETPEVELLYGFARKHWGTGYATESARACQRYGFEQLGLERLVAITRPENIASQRVLEKIGMRFEKAARYYDNDVNYYCVTRERYEPTDAPYSLREI
jgi:RimJ/RimL family protein N-acetyltransferase